jgi:hypothetical protein
MVNLLCSLSGVACSDAEDVSGTNGNIFPHKNMSTKYLPYIYDLFEIQFLKE